MELYRIAESIRAYTYLILSSQVSARLCIVGNLVSALTAQRTFLNNFENIVNCRVNIQEDIKSYQDTLSYALSKADYSMGESIYMLPSDMNLNIRSGTVGYNNKIFVSDSGFTLTRNDMVNTSAPKKSSNKTSIILKKAKKICIVLKNTYKEVLSKHISAIMHEEEKIDLVLILTSAFGIWYTFR